MATTATDNTRPDGTTNINVGEIFGIIVGSILFLVAVIFVLIRCLSAKVRANERAHENEFNAVELGQVPPTSPFAQEGVTSNVPNRRTDEIKTRASTWEDELRFYRSMQRHRETDIPRDNSLSPRSKSVSNMAHVNSEIDVTDARQRVGHQGPDSGSPTFVVGPLVEEPEEYDESQDSDAGQVLVAEAIPIVKVTSKARPVEVRVGIDHIPRRATIAN